MALLFENCMIDAERREFRRDGELKQIEPKVFDFLTFVIEHRDRVVSRDELISAVWDGRIVSESALASCINAARLAIGDTGEEQRLIKTLPRKGLRFIGTVQVQNGPEAAASPLAIPDKPSIAVLPFQNISSDPEQEYFADGMVDDIIAGLSRIRWLFVIARNSSFVYKGKAVDVKQVGRELGVRYVLEGGVRKSGNRVRITAQLIEAQSGIHLWAERYDRMLDDVFAVQDDLTMSVTGAIEPSLRKVEIERVKRKRPDSLDAYDLFLRALPFTYSHRVEDGKHAIPLLERALALEPGYPAAHAALAWCHHFAFRVTHDQKDRAAAIEHARAAIAGGGNDDATALGMAGFVISLDEHDHATALNIFDRALALSNSNIFALCCSALVLSFMGRTEQAIEHAQRALRLSPFDFLNYMSCNALVISYSLSGEHEKAYNAAQRSVQLNPQFSVCHLFLAAALVGVGRLEEARAAAEHALSLEPTFTIRGFSLTVGFEPSVFMPLAEAWRKAGVPEA